VANYIPFLGKQFQPIDDFEGFSSFEMDGLLYYTFDEEKSPLRLNLNLTESEFHQMKFYAHMINYLVMLKELQPLKLTKLGNLPRRFCRDLYDSGVKDEDIWTRGDHPINQERDSTYIHVLSLLIKNIGLTKKRVGKLTLTQKGEKFLDNQDHPTLFQAMFQQFTRRFNWGYMDGYPESWIIQGGFAFSIFLLQRYGDVARPPEFYSEKFLKAFPMATKEFKDSYVTREKHFARAYTLRTFKRFLEWFGLVETSKDEHSITVLTIRKKPLIDKIFEWSNF